MLTQALKQEIQNAYRRFLDSKQLRARYGQKLMIAEIANTLGAIELDAEGHRSNRSGLCAIEAGTGTGKTVAYMLAVLPIARALDKTVVVSTATIALQEQILQRDLPDILRHSGLGFRFALAKGRGRYLCLSKLDQQLHDNSMQQALFAMDAAEGSPRPEEQAVKLYESMAKALLTSAWDGDRDSWPEALDDPLWQPLTAERNQCAGRRCQHVSQCGFIKSRDYLGSVDCIVANHDLVMADLALGGGAILPPPQDTIYIFDEAHHLPDIALRHFTGQLRLNGSLHWLDQSLRAVQEMDKQYPAYIELLDRLAPVPGLLLEIRRFYAELKPLVETLVQDLPVDHSDPHRLPHYRFPHGQLPDHLVTLASTLVKRYQPLLDALGEAHELLGKALDNNQTGLSLSVIEQLFASVGMMLGSAEKQYGLWQAYSKAFDDIPDSRWIQLVDSNGLIDYELAASPLLAAGTLRQSLWSQCFAAVLTSATLTALGQFQRLRMQSGLPDYARTAVVPSPFDYASKVQFVVPALKAEPNDQQHSEEVLERLAGLVEGHAGVLVLFASRRQLEDVYDRLPADLRERVLCQNQMSKQALLQEHRQRIDGGGQSILFGLASLAEGVDLPGDYCTHVIIVKLPFAAPGDPVSQALDEWLRAQGKNAFVEISLPEASQKLIQACGRLIRTETDSGQITLLDKRILTKRYGRQLLDTLPPFRQVLEQQG
ncbi:MAG TPA: ATP-dependent DNA helicase DinG [Pseudomonadales bacterium]